MKDIMVIIWFMVLLSLGFCISFNSGMMQERSNSVINVARSTENITISPEEAISSSMTAAKTHEKVSKEKDTKFHLYWAKLHYRCAELIEGSPP